MMSTCSGIAFRTAQEPWTGLSTCSGQQPQLQTVRSQGRPVWVPQKCCRCGGTLEQGTSQHTRSSK